MPECILCKSTNQIRYYNGKPVCVTCIKEAELVGVLVVWNDDGTISTPEITH